MEFLKLDLQLDVYKLNRNCYTKIYVYVWHVSEILM